MEKYGTEEKRSTTKQMTLGLLAFFTSIAPSMSLGFSAIAVPALLSDTNPHRQTIDQTSWVASVASIATPIGCFLSGPISDKLGRKNVLHAVNMVTLAGWLTIGVAFSVTSAQYPLLIVGRLLTGLSTGLVSASPGIYVAEVSSVKWRVVFTTSSGVFFSLGILAVYIFGAIFKEDWGTTAYITAIFPLISFVACAFFVPESPVWLVSKRREEEAKRSMAKIYGTNCPNMLENDFEALLKSRQGVKKTANKSFAQMFLSKLRYIQRPVCWKPFLVLSGYFFFQQLSGSFVVIFYALTIVAQAGITMDAYLVIVLIAIARLISALLVTMASRKFGRRPLSLLSGAGMTISMILLAVYSQLLENGTVVDRSFWSWVPLTLLLGYFFTSMLGFLSMPFAMVAEVYPTKVRGLLSGLTVCVGYVFNFAVIKTYPAMAAAMHNYVIFAFYGVVSLLGTVFVLFFLPETKGKTIEQIQEMFDGQQRIAINTEETASLTQQQQQQQKTRMV